MPGQELSWRPMMLEPIQRRASIMNRSLPASVLAHGLVAAAALLLVPQPLVAPAQRVVSVDIISPEQYAALFAPPSTATVPLPEPAAEAVVPVPPGRDDGLVEAQNLYAADILGDPANAEVRANFPLLASSEQVVQLCNMEALEQLRTSGAAPGADALVGYAFGDVTVDKDALRVEGGAYRSQGRWFHIRYDCTVLADMSGVRNFAYAVGDLVPPSEWEAHFLNSDDDWLN